MEFAGYGRDSISDALGPMGAVLMLGEVCEYGVLLECGDGSERQAEFRRARQLRARCVRLVREHAQEYPTLTAATTAVARQEGVSRESVRRWLAQAEVDDGTRPGVTSEESAEIKRLKAENRRLKEDNEILRRASIFFAGELDPRGR